MNLTCGNGMSPFLALFLYNNFRFDHRTRKDYIKHKQEHISRLHAHGATSNAVNSALIHSAGNGNLKIINMLLEYKADLTVRSRKGMLILDCLAVAPENSPIIKYAPILFAAGANIEGKKLGQDDATLVSCETHE